MKGRPSSSIDTYCENSQLKIAVWELEAEDLSIPHRDRVKIKNKIAALRNRISLKISRNTRTKNFSAVQGNLKELAKIVAKVYGAGAD